MDNQREMVARLLATPSGYAQLRLGFKLHLKQARVLDDLFGFTPHPGPLPLRGVEGRKTRLAWFCANEVGKTSRVGVAAILYALEIRKARVQCLSASGRQLKEQLSPNLKRQADKFKRWEFLDGSIKVNGINQAVFYTAANEGTVQGFHEEAEANAGEKIPQLMIVDESAGVKDWVLGAVEDRCNPTWLLFMGSPLSPSGMFYEMSRSRSGFYSTHRLNKLECITPKGGWHDPDDIARTIAKNNGLSMEQAQQIVLTGQHGGLIKDPLTLSSVFGEFATFVEYALLTLSEYEKCLDNPPDFQPGERHAFCDFGGGRAKNVLAVRHGNKLWIEKKWVEPDEMTAVGEFVRLFRKLNQQIGLKPDEIEGDGDGLGGPMVRRIQELGWGINDFHGGAKPRFNIRYQDAWSESWAEGCKLIKSCEIILPRDQELQSQLLGRKLKPHSTGKLKLESKEDMKLRGLASPDEADAAMVAACGCPKAFNIAGTPEFNEDWLDQAREILGDGQGIPGASC